MKPNALAFNDREAVRAWLGALEATADELIAVAQDQTDPPGRRELGRALASRMVAEASIAMESLIAFALRGLDDDDPESGDPAGSGGAGPP
jgi:hypothetical protein